MTVSAKGPSAPDIDALADQLYRLRPEEFAAARDQAIKEARQAKQPQLAKDLAALRRPTQSAWVVNLLARAQTERLEEYLGLADDLAEAQAAADVPALQRLTTHRRDLETRLLAAGRELAEAAGVPLTAAMDREVRETLTAAIALPEVADEVRSGRLLKPTSYAGFGMAPVVAVRPKAPPRESGGKRRAPGSGEQSPADETPPRSDQHESAGRRHLAEAQAKVDEAARLLDDRTAEAEAAAQQRDALRRSVHDLEEQLREANAKAVEAGRTALAARRAQEDAAKALAAAQKELERAEREAR